MVMPLGSGSFRQKGYIIRFYGRGMRKGARKKGFYEGVVCSFRGCSIY